MNASTSADVDAARPTAEAGGVVLEVRNLKACFGSREQPLRAVDDVSFVLARGRTVALVGESGCGKSVTALSLARLVPEPPVWYAGGSILFRGRDVLKMSARELPALRGAGIAYVFQEPGASLNPVLRVGAQIREAVAAHHRGVDPQAETLDLLRRVGIPEPERRALAYPHELSGGMQQRIVMAMALACRPAVLVADEPTTALDVTIQAQILDLLMQVQREFAMAILLITHNLGLVARVAHDVHVMYAGRIVESGDVETVLRHPVHPYTRGLLDAVPRLERQGREVKGIDGMVPNLARLPLGCRFHPRCFAAQERCRQEDPASREISPGHATRCHFPLSA